MPASAERFAAAGDLRSYFATQSDLLCQTAVTDAAGQPLDMTETVNGIVRKCREIHAAGNKLFFIGNGGSSSISSHMATDYSKNGDVRAMALNDTAMLTCLGNDLGYDRVFSKQVELYARKGDLVFVISSSGRSRNILNAAEAARAAGCGVITLSGFTPDNPLRKMGDINFFINSDRYGFVEIGHLTILHAILDFLCGLPAPSRPAADGAR
jgi:D-sedoheptulose 7-phosphate isomerase